MTTDGIPSQHKVKGDQEIKEATPTTEGVDMIPTTIGVMSTELTNDDTVDHTLVKSTVRMVEAQDTPYSPLETVLEKKFDTEMEGVSGIKNDQRRRWRWNYRPSPPTSLRPLPRTSPR